MVKFRYLSDVHLEFHKNIRDIIPPSDDESNTHLILAGDICHAVSNRHKPHPKLIEMLQSLKQRFKSVIYVSGNHEYYNNLCKRCLKMYTRVQFNYSNTNCKSCLSINDADAILKQICNDIGVVFLQKDTHIIRDDDGDIMIHGCTLFSDYRGDSWKVSNDLGNVVIDIQNLVDVHKDHQDWLIAQDFDNGYKNIVVTHFLPCAEMLKRQDMFSGAYFTDTYDKIPKKAFISHWICGHSHVDRTFVGEFTTFLLNPHGYPNEKSVHVREFDV